MPKILKISKDIRTSVRPFQSSSFSLDFVSKSNGGFCSKIIFNSHDFFFRLQIRYVMPSARLTLREEDVVRLALEFLHNRELHISQLSLERETGVINGNYSDDVLFLRQLILDGQWDDVLEFIQPLEALKAFDMRKFSYTILKHKYIELLCIKSEANVQGKAIYIDSSLLQLLTHFGFFPQESFKSSSDSSLN